MWKLTIKMIKTDEDINRFLMTGLVTDFLLFRARRRRFRCRGDKLSTWWWK